MQKRNVLNSPRLLELKKQRRRAILNKILIFGLGFLAFFVFLIYLSSFPSLNVSEIEIVGNKVIDAQMIKEVAEKQITGKYLWLFPKTNIFFYPKNNIKVGLQNKFKRLKDINLLIKNNKILEISLTERTASYTYCGTTLPLLRGGSGEGSEKCYFLDEDGYVFDEAPYFSGEVYFKFYGSTSTSETDNPLGSYFFRQNFKQLILFKNILLNLKLKPVALYITSGGDMEVFLSKGKGATTEPKIIFKMDSDFQIVAENLEAALTTEPLQSKFKNNYSKLQYIDLRFSNKVYDKFLE